MTNGSSRLWLGGSRWSQHRRDAVRLTGLNAQLQTPCEFSFNSYALNGCSLNRGGHYDTAADPMQGGGQHIMLLLASSVAIPATRTPQ
jgi:hypothetical protein